MIYVKIVRKSGQEEQYECHQVRRLNDAVEINHCRYPLHAGDDFVILDERGQTVEQCESDQAVMDVTE